MKEFIAMGARRHGQGPLALSWKCSKVFFLLEKIVNSPLRLAAGPAGGAHSSLDPLAGSRERALKGRGGVMEEDEGKG